MAQVWSNWSGCVKAWPEVMAEPASEEDLVDLVRGAATPVRVVGSGHSFTPLVESQGTIISLCKMSGVVDHDIGAQTARIKAGTTIRDLGPMLLEIGRASCRDRVCQYV